MYKPLIRWSVGDSTPQGFDAFTETIIRTPQALGSDFDYIICSNAVNMKRDVDAVATKYGVEVKQVGWELFPLPPSTCPPNPTDRQGSFWKLCPPRLRPEGHEILLDSDVIIRKRPPQFDEFLANSKPMISMENVRCYGKYHAHFDGEKGYNAGVIGLPPGFDFKEELLKSWNKFGSYTDLYSRDEQGLVAVTLTQFPFIAIPSDVIIPFLAGGKQAGATYRIDQEGIATSQHINSLSFEFHKFTYDEYGYHFCQVNRSAHQAWSHYRSGALL